MIENPFPVDNRTGPEIVRERIEMIGAVFNRKITETLILVFQDALEGYPAAVLKKAFKKAELSLQHFPTPKIMRNLCNEEMPSDSWRYSYRTGQDADGTPYRIDPATGEKLYRPQHCPEGREFLLTLRRLAIKEKP
jgi:hypothetical protein